MDAADRILELVREALAATPDVAVYDGKVPPVEKRPQRFAVVYVPPGVREAGTVGGQTDRLSISWQVTSLATADNPAAIEYIAWQARNTATRVRDYLVARKVTPAGSRITNTLFTVQGQDDQLVTTQAAGVVAQYEALA